MTTTLQGGGFSPPLTSLATPGGLFPPVLSLFVLFQISGIIGGTARAYTLDETGEDDGDGEGLDQYDYIQSLMDRIRQGGDNSLIQKRELYNYTTNMVKRRLCIRPTRSCNSRPNSCCAQTTCRCNLWGQNCRCLRMGLFQRWGR